jgi:hypothetical protein
MPFDLAGGGSGVIVGVSQTLTDDEQLHACQYSEKIPMEDDIVNSSSALMAMPIELCLRSGLQASEYPAVERLVFASHSGRNEDELNPEFLCSLFHFLFAMRTE